MELVEFKIMFGKQAIRAGTILNLYSCSSDEPNASGTYVLASEAQDRISELERLLQMHQTRANTPTKPMGGD